MPEKQITCLRCRHCKLIAETDMADPTPVIFCALKEDTSPLILSGCGLADPRQYDARGEILNAWRGKVGDKLKSAGAVESAWLALHFKKSSWERLTSATMRDKLTLLTMARYRGWKRSPDAAVYRPEKPKRAKQRRGLIFNELQCAYIEACYKADKWPRCSNNLRESGRIINQAIRDEIINEVNRLDAHGKIWKWESIRSHMKWKSPSYQRGMAERNRRKRERNKLKVLSEQTLLHPHHVC